MGRSYTPKYRVEYRTNLMAVRKQGADCASNVDGKAVCTMAWNNGRPNDTNLEMWRKEYNRSFQKGGVNHHVADMFGAVPHITWARIVNQFTNDVVSEVFMPVFEVA